MIKTTKKYYYQLTSEEASSIGRFSIDENTSFDPFFKNKDEEYSLVSKETYDILKGTEQFKRVDFSSKVLIEKTITIQEQEKIKQNNDIAPI